MFEQEKMNKVGHTDGQVMPDIYDFEVIYRKKHKSGIKIIVSSLRFFVNSPTL